eukprot:TRINITY_DN7821_c0_g1_i1.p1 TRINITY_DN7821_c0_g1~~TRINITY_DN7821_c0_g1_i1.p1  ORF type:complete len:722 (+),score=116.80 TRINITY_DN7821_c0_g1_i1:82-2247(+)
MQPLPVISPESAPHADGWQDPRTGLRVVGVPATFLKAFPDLQASGSAQPVLYFFSAAQRVTSKGNRRARFIAVSDAAVFVCTPESVVKRCVRIADVSQLGVNTSENQVYLRVPTEYDLHLCLDDEGALSEFVGVLEAAYAAARPGRSLEKDEFVGIPALALKRPKDFRLQVVKLTTREHVDAALESRQRITKDTERQVQDRLERLRQDLRCEMQEFKNAEIERLTNVVADCREVIERRELEIAKLKDVARLQQMDVDRLLDEVSKLEAERDALRVQASRTAESSPLDQFGSPPMAPRLGQIVDSPPPSPPSVAGIDPDEVARDRLEWERLIALSEETKREQAAEIAMLREQLRAETEAAKTARLECAMTQRRAEEAAAAHGAMNILAIEHDAVASSRGTPAGDDLQRRLAELEEDLLEQEYEVQRKDVTIAQLREQLAEQKRTIDELQNRDATARLGSDMANVVALLKAQLPEQPESQTAQPQMLAGLGSPPLVDPRHQAHLAGLVAQSPDTRLPRSHFVALQQIIQNLQAELSSKQDIISSTLNVLGVPHTGSPGRASSPGVSARAASRSQLQSAAAASPAHFGTPLSLAQPASVAATLGSPPPWSTPPPASRGQSYDSPRTNDWLHRPPPTPGELPMPAPRTSTQWVMSNEADSQRDRPVSHRPARVHRHVVQVYPAPGGSPRPAPPVQQGEWPWGKAAPGYTSAFSGIADLPRPLPGR